MNTSLFVLVPVAILSAAAAAQPQFTPLGRAGHTNSYATAISADGVVVIKAQQYRSLERNSFAALERLRELISKAACIPRQRRATKPTRNSQKRRLDSKMLHGKVKAQRGRVSDF